MIQIPNHTIKTIFVTLCLLGNLLKTEAQIFKNTINLGGADLPFREVLASYEDENKYLWLLVTNELCRISGNDKDCFEIPIKETTDLFRVDKRYFILHNKLSNAAVYFDTKLNTFLKFNFPNTSKIYRNISEQNELFYYDMGMIYRYDFLQKKGILIKKYDYKFSDNRHKLFKADKNVLIGTQIGNIWINEKRIEVEKGDLFAFLQVFDTDQNYIFSNGKSVSNINKKDFKITKLYSDSLVCKSLWQDDQQNFALGLHKENLCQIIEELKFFDKNWIPIKDAPVVEKIQTKNFAAQMTSSDFTKKWNVSVWNGFKQYAKVQNISERILYEPLDGRPFNNVITDFTIDDEDNIYVMSEDQKIFKLHNSGKIETIKPNVFIKDRIKPMTLGRSIIYDEKKQVLYGGCGEYNGQYSSLLQMDKSLKNIKTILGLEDRIWDFYKHDRILYIACQRNIVFTYDLDLMKLDTFAILTSKEIHPRSMHLSNSTLYIGTKQGLFTVDIASKKQGKVTALAGIVVNKISEYKNKLYLSTMSGIYIMDKNNNVIERFTTKNGLPDDDVKGVMFFNDNEALVPTSKGVGKVNFNNKLCYIYNNSKIDLSDDENNSMAQFQHKGKIYLGTINGIDVFNTDKLNEKNKERPFISKIITFNSERKENITYNVEKVIQFDPNDLKCIIHFGSKLNNKNVSYAVKKEEDSDWTFVSGQTFELLRPKSRTKLIIKCTNEYGVWSDDQQVVDVECSEHFYRRPEFYLLLTALISGLTFYFSKRRENEIKKNNEFITELQSRIEISKLESLQAQMNPHFLFNAMSSIQYLLKTNQNKKADEMLTSFSKLIRKTLESSVKLVWTLEEEIAMLHLYCNIEKERFESDRIEVNIDTNGIDLDEIQIPPMIVQPFVENAFKHAFTNVKQGKLDIIFSEKEDYLKIEIRDNGIGFNASRQKESDEIKGPRGMLITKDRINLYSAKIGRKIDFEINERREAGVEQGTSILITIPI